MQAQLDCVIGHMPLYCNLVPKQKKKKGNDYKEAISSLYNLIFCTRDALGILLFVLSAPLIRPSHDRVEPQLD